MVGYISIRQVLDNLLVHPLLQDLPLERAVNYSQELIRIVGCPKLFTEKVAQLTLKEYRTPLPCDCIEVIQVRGLNKEEYRYTTDNFHMAPSECDNIDATYKIQGTVLYSSRKEGDIEVAYQGIAVDEDGFPLIPDNSSFIKALEYYIKKQWFTILFDMGKITQQAFNNAQQEYSWYVGQAQSDLVNPSNDEMASITAMWNTLIPRIREHRNGYKTLGTREYIKQH